MHTLRVALKYFTFGLIAGLLLAPRAGRETRKMIIEQGSERLQGAFGSQEQPLTEPRTTL